MFRIATTETYDPAHCVKDWVKRADEFDFVLFITKIINKRICSEKVLTEERCHELSYNYNGKFFPDEKLSSVQDIYDQIKVVTEHYPDITFESCASNVLTKYGFVECGCMSEKDLLINGID